MDEMTAFEQRFEDRVRIFARPVSRRSTRRPSPMPWPSGSHAHRGAGSTVTWQGLRLDRRAWTIAVVLGLLAALLGGALLVGARLLRQPPLDVTPAVNNGWIAYSVSQPGPDGVVEDTDIWFASLDQEARRAVGGESDRVDQLCPAFSPDGRSLAYGQDDGQQAALVVADVSDDGRVSDRLTIDVGDGLPPPCPVWSPDGRQVAFGVNRTSPINPTTTAAGSEVWIVDVADRGITALPDLLATDLEWSPDGGTLAIASGAYEPADGEALQDGRIHLYEPSSGAMRTLDQTLGAIELTWSPDGRSIAYAAIDRTAGDTQRELRVINVESRRQRALTAQYGILHGIGPVWSPDGETILYQRGLSGEHSEVVLLTPGDLSDESVRPRQAVVPVTAGGSSERLDPYRVAWSPDGRYLLMMAWGVPSDTTTGTVEDPIFVAVPVDAAMSTVVLSRVDGLNSWDGYDDTTFVPIQTWGRSPSD